VQVLPQSDVMMKKLSSL